MILRGYDELTIRIHAARNTKSNITFLAAQVKICFIVPMVWYVP